MKTSELIEKLQETVRCFGDYEIHTMKRVYHEGYDEDSEETFIMDIEDTTEVIDGIMVDNCDGRRFILK